MPLPGTSRPVMVLTLAIVFACGPLPPEHSAESAYMRMKTDHSDHAFLRQGGEVPPPIGFVQLCMTSHEECLGGTDVPRALHLTHDQLAQLDEVNSAVNSLKQFEDHDDHGHTEHWDFAGENGGDCEDLSLEKRRRLIGLGWPRDALLIATVRHREAADAPGEGHAVLVLATADGDLVLDNLNDDILHWSDTPYEWTEMQSRERPFVWVSLEKAISPHLRLAYFPPLGDVPDFMHRYLSAADEHLHEASHIHTGATAENVPVQDTSSIAR